MRDEKIVDGIKLTEDFYLFTKLVEDFSSCMNDYLYVYDVQNDVYCIAESALERFNVERSVFDNVIEEHRKFVHPDDYDYLMKELMDIVTGIKTDHNLRYRWLGPRGEAIWINCRGKVIMDAHGNPLYMLGCINEIGSKQEADNISGLLGEMSLREQMHQYVAFPTCQFLRIGIDGFKSINELNGAEYGDWILYEVAAIIQDCLEVGQNVYRVGADEFIIFDRINCTKEAANSMYKQIRNKIDSFIDEHNYETIFTISCGVLFSTELELADYHEIDKYSQFALSAAKEAGRNQIHYFDKDEYEVFTEDQKLIKKLRKSVKRGFQGFELYYQPIVKPGTGELYAAEALLRYRDEKGKLVSPASFIRQLEDSGLIIPVGRWVMEEACAACVELRKRLQIDDFKMGINLSYVQLLKSPIYRDLTRIIEKYELPAEAIVVELTESGYLGSDPTIMNVWNKLHRYGVQISIDDFGTGYSNIMYIGKMKPEIVKIDREFTIRAFRDEYVADLVKNLAVFIHQMKIRVVVEGIETEEELQKILGISPDAIQGYFYSKPCALSEFIERFVDKA